MWAHIGAKQRFLGVNFNFGTAKHLTPVLQKMMTGNGNCFHIFVEGQLGAI